MYTITVFGKEVFRSDNLEESFKIGLNLFKSSWFKDTLILKDGVQLYCCIGNFTF
jgi:hypothetical protein